MISQINLKNKLLVKVCSYMLYCIVTVHTCSAVEDNYTLANAIHSAKELNQDIQALDENLVRSKAEIGKAMSSFAPDVSVNQTYGRTDLNDSADHIYQRSRNFAIEHTLFQSGASFGQFVGAKRAFQSVKHNYINNVQEIYFNTVEAYENFLTSKDIVEFSIKREQLLKNQRDLNQTRFDYQDIPITDLLQAKASYANAIATRETAEGNLRSAKAKVEGLIYSPIPYNIREIDHNKIASYLPSNLQGFLDEVKRTNPVIAAQKYNYEAARAGVYISTTNVLPKVTGKVEWFDNYSPFPNQFGKGQTKGKAAYLQIRIPLIPNGGADFFAIKQANSDKQKSLAQYKAAQQAIEAQAVIAWNEYISAEAVRIAAYQNMIAEQKTLEGVQEEARVGARDIIQVLDVEQRYFDAQVNHRRAIQNKIVAAFKILALLGKLYDLDYSLFSK